MRRSDAKREFEMRRYYWLLSEFEKEINCSFPNLRLFKSGFAWKMQHYLKGLGVRDQMTLAHAILKRWFSAELIDLGEAVTDEEKMVLESFDRFALEPSVLEVEIQAKKQNGARIEFAGKRKLRKVAVSKFVDAFGSECVDMRIGEEWDPLFRMKCCGWILSTQLMFGQRQGLIHYRHIIESELRIKHPANPQITGPAMTLSPGVAWLVNQWEDVMDWDVEGVCSALIKQVGFFLEAAPKLLKGLEFQRITES